MGATTLVCSILLAVAAAEPAPPVAIAQASDGVRVRGSLVGATPETLAFVSGERRRPASNLASIEFESHRQVLPALAPAHRFHLRGGERITGVLREWTHEAATVNIRGLGETRIPLGSLARVEPAGGVIVLHDDGSDASSWTTLRGGVVAVARPPAALSDSAVSVTRTGGNVQAACREPIASGWISLAVIDTTARNGNPRWRVEFDFRDGDGSLRPIRVSCRDGRYAVSAPDRKLARNAVPISEGWTRLTVVFDAQRTVVLSEDRILAEVTGNGSGLFAVSVSQSVETAYAARADVWADDLTAVRADEAMPPAMGLASDDLDVLTFRSGESLFGTLADVSPQRVEIAGEFGPAASGWDEIAGVRLANRPWEAAEIRGLICRLQFQTTIVPALLEADELCVAVQQASVEGLTVEHADLGRLIIPWGHIRRLEPLYLGSRRWIVRDPCHLGESVRGDFVQPLPRGTTMGGTFEGVSSSTSQIYLRVAVSDLEPAGANAPPGTPFLAELREGGLATRLELNGEILGTLNERLAYRTAPGARTQSLRVRLEPDALRESSNGWRLVQRPSLADPSEFDDCEVGPIVLEVESPGND